MHGLFQLYRHVSSITATRPRRGVAALLQRAMERLGLAARAYHRVLKLARTIADRAGAEDIQPPHLTEALSHRRLDRTST